jgi:hypothetical protein
LLQTSGFIFDARFAYAPYLQGTGQPLLLNLVSQPGVLVPQSGLSHAQGITYQTQVGHSVLQHGVLVS